MLQTYLYSLKKNIVAKSTWVLLVIIIAFIFFFAGFVVYKSFLNDGTNSYNGDLLLGPNGESVLEANTIGAVSMSLNALSAILAMFTAIFCGFKAAFMLRDEVEDGSFLIFISKPISRRVLIGSKFFALLTLVFSYTLITSSIYVLSIKLQDLSHQNYFKGNMAWVTLLTV
jgi:ABC-type transport system involved in multi-copper enzyme maturation permease subunit